MPSADPMQLDDVHREALAWFEARAGQIVPWPDPLANGQLLAARAKGIYKPSGWAHALSVRVIPSGRYPDEEPVPVGEGRWRFRYHQEEPDGADAAGYFTNRALARCLTDEIPVGVLWQRQPKPAVRYEVFGLARVTDWRDGLFTLEGPVSIGDANTVPDADGSLLEDARDRVLAEIAQRRGQAAFRTQLLAAYGGRCAISGCDVEAVLEAAHIVPYRGPHSNRTDNGLLLRADLHTLFDLDLLRIAPWALTVQLDPTLRDSPYGEFDGRALALPVRELDRPSSEAIRQRALDPAQAMPSDPGKVALRRS
ncbi:MAG: HNH endonuclease [Hyphomonadaceae bacterium]|nr:HNH endonuclease [Hyphomonadaceae bacterium]